MTEFEIRLLKDELVKCNYDFDNYKDCSERIIDALELKIEQLEDKLDYDKNQPY